MKAKLKFHLPSKQLQDSQIMDLSDFIELSDTELKLLVGGWGNGWPNGNGNGNGNPPGGGFQLTGQIQ